MFWRIKKNKSLEENRLRHSSRGFTLIEVLVAIVILAFGLVMIVQNLARTQDMLRISQNMVTASQIGVQKLSENEITLKESIKLSTAHERGEEKWRGRKFLWESEVNAYQEPGLQDETKLNQTEVVVRWQDGTVRKNQARFTMMMMNLERKSPEMKLLRQLTFQPVPPAPECELRVTRKLQRGFTLIEVLLAITLFALVSTAAVSVFSMGLQIWKRSRQTTAVDRKAVLALEKMSQDLREMILVKPPDESFSIQKRSIFDYGGKSDEVRIPSVLPDTLAAGMGGFAQKTYRWDRGKNRLCRSVETASDLFRKRPQRDCQSPVPHITRLRFRYRLPSGITGSYSWFDEWEMSSGLPLGVQIEMEVTPPDSKSEKRIFKRSVAIPVSTEMEEEKK